MPSQPPAKTPPPPGAPNRHDAEEQWHTTRDGRRFRFGEYIELVSDG